MLSLSQKWREGVQNTTGHGIHSLGWNPLKDATKCCCSLSARLFSGYMEVISSTEYIDALAHSSFDFRLPRGAILPSARQASILSLIDKLNNPAVHRGTMLSKHGEPHGDLYHVHKNHNFYYDDPAPRCPVKSATSYGRSETEYFSNSARSPPCKS